MEGVVRQAHEELDDVEEVMALVVRGRADRRPRSDLPVIVVQDPILFGKNLFFITSLFTLTPEEYVSGFVSFPLFFFFSLGSPIYLNGFLF